MRKIAMVGIFLASAGLAWAGATNHCETSVLPRSYIASGSFQDTRFSPDSIQYILCDMYLSGGQARLDCLAMDVDQDYLTCHTTDPEIIKIAQYITDQSYIYFRCDANKVIQYLYVSNGSRWNE
jgi:hypothetical protein